MLLTKETFEADDRWVRTWGAAPQRADHYLAEIADATLRQEVRLSCGGDRFRIRFTNECGSSGIAIGAASVGVAGASGMILPGTLRRLSFGDAPSAFLPAGAPAISDPVDLLVPPLTRLVISAYVPGRVCEVTGHDRVSGPGWTLPGDQTGIAELPSDAEPLGGRALLAGVETLVSDAHLGIVAIGNSFTDGAGATDGAGGGWPEQLAARFAATSSRPVAVANHGIDGNRLPHSGLDGSILARLDRDALAVPGVTHLVAATAAPVITTDIIGAYRQIIDRAHGRGIAVFGATLTPYGGSTAATPEGEETRLRINDWIRAAGAFDAVLDFDAVWRDPDEPARLTAGFDLGDHMHGNDAGYRALAESIDLALFEQSAETYELAEAPAAHAVAVDG